ncbi:MAG: MBL fold metallo-hydrolase [Bacteroidota bacterium]
MTVTFYGVRGSTPAPGTAFARYGGHTTCAAVALGDRVLVLDAGTGIRPLGRALLGRGDDLFVLLTHLHADHVTGFPFFAPLYEEGRTIHLIDYEEASWSPLALFDGVHYPLRPGDLPCSVQRTREQPMAFLRAHGLPVTRQAVNHPGGAYGYRVGHEGQRFVFMPDNELGDESLVPRETIVAFCQGADVLCHDAQYLEDEIEERRGWGHSSVSEAVELAVEAGVGHLVLTHHDPDRTDDDLDRVQARARAALGPHGIACTVAYEGLTFHLGEADPLPPDPGSVATKAQTL